MCSLRLVLGWQPLLETDEAALPTLGSLCQALDVETHWDEAEKTLYIKSPTIGKKVAIVAGEWGTSDGLPFAGQIGHAIAERLSRAGAEVNLVGEATSLRGFDVGLRVDLATLPGWGVAVGYPLPRWFESRKLATALVEEVAGATGLLNLGTRVMLGSAWRTGVPVMSVLIGGPGATHSPQREVQSLGHFVADGVYRGLARFWADPMLEEIQRLLPIFQTEVARLPRPAVVAANPEPAPIVHNGGGETVAEALPEIRPAPAAVPKPDPPLIDASPAPLDPVATPPAGSYRCTDLEPEVVAASDPTKPAASGLDRVPQPPLPGAAHSSRPRRPRHFRHPPLPKAKTKKPDETLARVAWVRDEDDAEPAQPFAAPAVRFGQPVRPVEARLTSSGSQGTLDPRRLPNSGPVYIFQRPLPVRIAPGPASAPPPAPAPTSAEYMTPPAPSGAVLPIEPETVAPETPEAVAVLPAAVSPAAAELPGLAPETAMPRHLPTRRESKPKVQVIEGSQRIIRFP